MERKTVLNTDEQSGSRGYGNPDREHDRSRAMGSALAKALLATDLGVTVWNRSSDKSDALAAEGAAVAESISEAVDCSEVIVVCVRGYDVANDLFRDEGVAALLAGKGAAFGPESAGRPVQPASQDAFSGSVSHDGPPARWWVAAKRLTGEGRTFRRNKSVEITGAEAGTGAAALDG